MLEHYMRTINPEKRLEAVMKTSKLGDCLSGEIPTL